MFNNISLGEIIVIAQVLMLFFGDDETAGTGAGRPKRHPRIPQSS